MENLSPQILRGVVREMTELVKGAPEGIRVHMNDEDITDIQATITGPGIFNRLILCVRLQLVKKERDEMEMTVSSCIFIT